ncbi:MAG: hypothetical protein JW753_05675 [Dehalococcoidia bacterium]|nr:hypothetical protein [Dehalococcoidia bacterium]
MSRETLRDQCLKLQEFRTKVASWYCSHGRDFPWRHADTSYQRVIGELLLQRTRARVVAGFYLDFLAEYPSWESLSRANEKDLQGLLRNVGLWRRRARSLIDLASAVMDTGGQLPDTRAELEKLPGIGQYMASAVLVLCYGEREPLLDVNMARVLERVFGPRQRADIRYDPYLQDLARSVVQVDNAVEANWAVLDLAAGICTIAHPKCHECPLVCLCSFASQAT